MRLLHHHLNSTSTSKCGSLASRSPGPAFAAMVLIAAGLALSGCGSSGSSASAKSNDSAAAPVILDTEKVERAIEASSLAQRGKRPRVSCPSGVHQKQGTVFSCTATVKKDNTQFEVTVMTASGQVHYVAR